MKKDSKILATTLSEVATSAEVIIMDETGKVKKIGQYRDLYNEWNDDQLFYRRLAYLIEHKRVYIL